MDEKLKSENMQKKNSFLNWSGENGAMLTTYLFRYTSGVSERLDITREISSGFCVQKIVQITTFLAELFSK